MSVTAHGYDLKASIAVWIAAASLHARLPESEGFTQRQIEDEVKALHLFQKDPSTISQHISQHLAATKRANAKPRRMLTELGDGRRRLFVDGDGYHASRKGSAVHPSAEDLPVEYRPLLQWYEGWSRKVAGRIPTPGNDPLLALAGTWTFGDADTYLREHRDGWGE